MYWQHVRAVVPFVGKWGARTAVLVLTILFLFSDQPVQAGSLTVNTLTDKPIDSPTIDDGLCSLREAVEAANNNAPVSPNNGADCPAGNGADTITFSVSGAITFVEPMYINSEITISGPIILDGNHTTNFFNVSSSGRFTVMNLTMQNGKSGFAGAIQGNGDGKINAIGTSFIGNESTVRGGAILTSAELNILGSNFAGNKAAQSGGAIYFQGGAKESLNIAGTNFAGNIAEQKGGAIALITTSPMNITDSIFSGNIAQGSQTGHGGGAIFIDNSYEDNSVNIERTAFNGNLTPGGQGGALFLTGDIPVNVTNSSFNGNISGGVKNGRGGAIYAYTANLHLSKTAFNANIAARDISNTPGNGGALFNLGSTITVANSSFFANVADDGFGGALYSNDDPRDTITELMNVTISGNIANSGGAIYNFNDDNNHQHRVGVVNTIIEEGATGSGGSCAAENLLDLGNNLQYPGTTCGPTITSADPLLAPPSFNGGAIASLLTLSLGVGSPARDAGSNTSCADEPVGGEDQRGDPRPKGATCDIGSFEADPAVAGYGSTPIQPGPINLGNTSVGATITTTFTIFETGNTTLTVSNPAIGGANPGEFSVLAAFPLNIASGSQDVTLRCNANVVGSHTATLTLNTNDPAHPSVTYNLLCNVQALPVPGFSSNPAAPGPLDFGGVEVGQSASLDLTFLETGNATLNLGPIDISGPNAADFSFNAFDTVINDGEAPVVLLITCTPADEGLRTAVITLHTKDPLKSTVTYNLVCDGTPPPSPHLYLPGTSYINGQNGISNLDGAYDVVVSPDGRHVYATSLLSGRIAVFNRDAATGALTQAVSYSHVQLTSPRGIAISPDGQQVYVVGSSSDNLFIYNRNSSNGWLTLADTWTNGEGGFVTGLDGPESVVVSPDGRFIYVSATAGDSVVIFYRDSDGFVGYEETLTDATNLDGAQKLTVSPDGANLYVTSFTSASNGRIATYQRNAQTGSLTLLQTRFEGQLLGSCSPFCFFLDGLAGAFDVVVSQDGRNVYTANLHDNTVARFTRNSDGTLNWGGVLRDGVNGVDGFNSVRGLEISPDGRYLYAVAYTDQALTVLSRDEASGILSPYQTIFRNSGTGLPALNGAISVAVSPDGSSIYTAAYLDDAIVLLHTANPVATLDSLQPASLPVGSAAATLVVNGESFVPGSVVRVNGAARTTNFVSANQLEATLTVADLATAGTRTITVFNPTPGGGVSNNSLPFVVQAANQNPKPSIDYLSPQGADAGGPAFTLAINGSNFMQGSTVQWNGVNRATSFINSGEVRITVTATDLLLPGTAVIAVINPAPGGGSSNLVSFTVAAPGENPVPTLTKISPESIGAGGAGSQPVVVTITGKNFVLGAQAYWQGNGRPTTFISSTQLQVTLTAYDVAFANSGALTVVNSGPGGGTSNPVTFEVYAYVLYLPFVVR
ncbi:MAG: beta-propeller fold lactonase family protein [Ardenticatenaceae bacterium]|nr:beta-propeller fold lactonase family protein [Ardenticatenaceae bacterium]